MDYRATTAGNHLSVCIVAVYTGVSGADLPEEEGVGAVVYELYDVVAGDDGDEENRDKTEERDEEGHGLHGGWLVVGGWRPTAERACDGLG